MCLLLARPVPVIGSGSMNKKIASWLAGTPDRGHDRLRQALFRFFRLTHLTEPGF